MDSPQSHKMALKCRFSQFAKEACDAVSVDGVRGLAPKCLPGPLVAFLRISHMVTALEKWHLEIQPTAQKISVLCKNSCAKRTCSAEQIDHLLCTATLSCSANLGWIRGLRPWVILFAWDSLDHACAEEAIYYLGTCHLKGDVAFRLPCHSSWTRPATAYLTCEETGSETEHVSLSPSPCHG